MKLKALIAAAAAGIVLIMFCMVMSSKNGAICLEETVNTAQSSIDVHLANRFNKLQELAACVKKYDEHEASTLEKVIAARGKNMTGAQAKECIAAFSRVEERYPELKSQTNYAHLMNDISITENHLAQQKKAYNEAVRDYRYYVRKFPTSTFLSLTSYVVQRYEMYFAEESMKDKAPLQLF